MAKSNKVQSNVGRGLRKQQRVMRKAGPVMTFVFNEKNSAFS